jgi:hypothetical protein
MVMGYSHLVEPDVYTPPTGAPIKKFKLNGHMGEAQQAAFVKRLQAYGVDALEAAWTKECAKAKRPQYTTKVKGKVVAEPWEMPDAQAWLDAALCPAREGSSLTDPYVTFSNAAEYTATDRATGEKTVKLKTMAAFDKDDNRLDLATMKLAMGSIVQPILMPGLWASTGQVAISLKLQGIRVLKAEVYGKRNSLGDISDEDLALLGDTEMDDLSAYVKAAPAKEASAPAHHDDETMSDDLDDALPF